MGILETIEDLRKKVEWLALEMIKQLTEIGKMTQEQAQAVAQHTLDCVKPGMSATQFFQGVFKLDDGFPEMAFIVVPLATLYKEKIEDKTVPKVRELIKNARYDEAVSMAIRLVDREVGIKLVGQSAKGGHNV